MSSVQDCYCSLIMNITFGSYPGMILRSEFTDFIVVGEGSVINPLSRNSTYDVLLLRYSDILILMMWRDYLHLLVLSFTCNDIFFIVSVRYCENFIRSSIFTSFPLSPFNCKSIINLVMSSFVCFQFIYK